MHFSHFLDLIEIYHKAPLISMILLDALSTEDSEVIRAIEMLHSLVVLVTQQTLYAVLVFKIDVTKDIVSFHNLIEDIEVQG